MASSSIKTLIADYQHYQYALAYRRMSAGLLAGLKGISNRGIPTVVTSRVPAHCPNAEVVYDLFAVVAKYGREVIDRVRVDEANRLRDQRQDRKVIKSSRWLLLRNRRSLSQGQAVKLDEILDANRALMTEYVLRDELKRLWFYRRRG